MSEKLNPIVGEVFYVDKPLHWTSFYAVKHIRGVLQKRLGMKKLRWDTPERSTLLPQAC